MCVCVCVANIIVIWNTGAARGYIKGIHGTELNDSCVHLLVETVGIELDFLCCLSSLCFVPSGFVYVCIHCLLC